MKAKISALLDGELAVAEVREVGVALRHDEDLRHSFGAYALIGDALRNEPYLSMEVSGAVLRQLADEPVVMAPRNWGVVAKAPGSWNRPLLAMAATMAGVAVVAWLGLPAKMPASATLAMFKPDAQQAFDNALKINPKAAEALVGKGQIALQQYEMKDADKFADEAIKANPRLPSALYISMRQSASCEGQMRITPSEPAMPR